MPADPVLEEVKDIRTLNIQHSSKLLCVVIILFGFIWNRFVRGLISNVHLARLHMSSPKFFSPTNSQSEMLGHIPIGEGYVGYEDEGEGGAEQDGSLCGRWDREPIKPLLLLIQAMQVNGHPLPIGSFTAQAIVSVVQKCTGYHPVNVEVMSGRDAIIELEPEIRVGEVAQLLHGTHEWDGQLTEIGCLLSTCKSIVNVVQERKNGHARLQ